MKWFFYIIIYKLLSYCHAAVEFIRLSRLSGPVDRSHYYHTKPQQDHGKDIMALDRRRLNIQLHLTISYTFHYSTRYTLNSLNKN